APPTDGYRLHTADIVVTSLPQPFSNSGGLLEEHGYLEYRFLVENRSTERHRVTLTLPRWRRGGSPSGPYLRFLKRTVEVEPKTPRAVELGHADVPLFGGNDVEVEIDGKVRPEQLVINLTSNHGSHRSDFARQKGEVSSQILTTVELE